jgi:hypothetical protein
MTLLSLTDNNGNPVYLNTDSIIGATPNGVGGTTIVIDAGSYDVQQTPAQIASQWVAWPTVGMTLTSQSAATVYVNAQKILGFYGENNYTVLEISTGRYIVSQTPAQVAAAWPSGA